MNPQQKLVARKMMKLRIHEAKGTGYQRLFEKVMGYAHPGFTPIRPYGKVGDRKNDGYVRSEGLYYQVYAPERPDHPKSAPAAAEKAATDFKGLKAEWSKDTPLREFRFTYNDSYLGSPPPLESALAKIRKDHKIEARAFLAKDLEDLALTLTEDQLADVIGLVVPDDQPFDTVDYGILGEVISHVLERPKSLDRASVLLAPDFDEKLKFNGITTPVASLLRVGAYQNDAVTDYFSLNSRYARQELRNHLSALYAASKAHVAATQCKPNEVGDLVFFDLLNDMTPSDRGIGQAQKARLQEASLVIMAFYFEACDVFEEPSVTS